MNSSGWRPVLARAITLQNQGIPAVIVTVISNTSSVLLEPGRRLIISLDGEPGTDQFSILHSFVREDGLRQLAARRSRLCSYRVTPEHAERTAPQAGNVDIYYEVIDCPPRLIVVGCGHIAVPLARIAKLLDFHVTVLDDRPEFASVERFPEADRVLVGPYRETVAGLPIDADTHIVLVTRGHVHDQACLEEVIDSPAAYIGMIGSRKRVRTVMAHAQHKGHAAEKLERVHAPIGLDIGSETPGEIAVAIVAEIINVRRGGRSPSLSLGERLRV
jgi:xanthine dehydrogenase accessory factor